MLICGDLSNKRTCASTTPSPSASGPTPACQPTTTKQPFVILDGTYRLCIRSAGPSPDRTLVTAYRLHSRRSGSCSRLYCQPLGQSQKLYCLLPPVPDGSDGLCTRPARTLLRTDSFPPINGRSYRLYCLLPPRGARSFRSASSYTYRHGHRTPPRG